MKKNLIGLLPEELADLITSIGQPKFRATQLWQYIYAKGYKDFDAMTSLGKECIALLKKDYSIARPEVKVHQVSSDGTQKVLLDMGAGHTVETVFIPLETRGTVCISSQVGCNMGCTFCNTGTQKMVRNLTAYEITSQVMLIKDILGDWQNPTKKLVSNLVFMGMGEPLHNYSQVKNAILILKSQSGLAFSKRRITVSTCGIVPMINKMSKELDVSLALSLHAPNDELRSSIMPINHKYSIKELIECCKNYYQGSTPRRITIEYIMLLNVNDEIEHAHELAELLRGFPVKINLIPFNPWGDIPLERSSNNRVHKFMHELCQLGYSVSIRVTRGDDISAACGQLKTESKRVSKRITKQ